jgi:hypothetical protein
VKLSTTKAAMPVATSSFAQRVSRVSDTPALPWATTMAGTGPVGLGGSSRVPKTVAFARASPRASWKYPVGVRLSKWILPERPSLSVSTGALVCAPAFDQ